MSSEGHYLTVPLGDLSYHVLLEGAKGSVEWDLALPPGYCLSSLLPFLGHLPAFCFRLPSSFFLSSTHFLYSDFSHPLVFFVASFCSLDVHMQRSEGNLGCYPHLTAYLQQLLNWFADVNARSSWPVRDPSLSRSSGFIEIGATNLVYVDAGGSMQVRRLAHFNWLSQLLFSFFLFSHKGDNDHEDNNNTLFEQHPSPGGPFVPVLLHATGLSFMFPFALSIA